MNQISLCRRKIGPDQTSKKTGLKRGGKGEQGLGIRDEAIFFSILFEQAGARRDSAC